MPSTDPEPGRTLRSLSAQVSLCWSRDAGRAYSLLERAPARISLTALIKRAARETLRHSPPREPLIETALQENLPVAIDLSVVSDEEIRELNFQYRGKNRPTDVLSFSQIENGMAPAPMASEVLLLGDIVVSIESAARQAAELQHSLEQEMAFLTAHGTLHLCGYNHDTSARRRAMWKQQDQIVRLLNIG